MSFAAVDWAVRQKLPCVQKMVLIMLADRHNKDSGRCDPSHDKLADDCGLSRRAVIDNIAKLAEAGLITPIHRVRDKIKTSNYYRLHLSRGVQADVQEMHIDVQEMHKGSAGDALGVVQEMHINPEVEPVTEPVNTNTRQPAAPIDDIPVKPAKYDPLTDLTDVDPQVAADWLAHRKAKRAPVTATVIRSLRKGAATAGIALEAVLEVCCARGWAGFDPTWLESKKTSPAAAESFRERDARIGRERWEQMTGEIHPDNKPTRSIVDVFDAEDLVQLPKGATNVIAYRRH